MDISPIYIGNFTKEEQKNICFQFNILVDLTSLEPLSEDLSQAQSIMYICRGILNDVLSQLVNDDIKTRSKRFIFGYCADSEPNAYAYEVTNILDKNTLLVTVSTGMVLNILETATDLVNSLGRLLIKRPFIVPNGDENFSDFIYGLSIITLQLIFFHEYIHCSKNHLNIWKRLIKLKEAIGVSEKLNSSETSLLNKSKVKTRIRRAMEVDADKGAAKLLGAIYHYHDVGPNEPWFGNLTERHKLIACELSSLVFGISFSKLNKFDTINYQSPLKRGLDIFIEIIYSTRLNKSHIDEHMEDLNAFISCLEKDQTSTLISSSNYISALPLADQTQAHKDLLRLVRFSIIDNNFLDTYLRKKN